MATLTAAPMTASAGDSGLELLAPALQSGAGPFASAERPGGYYVRLFPGEMLVAEVHGNLKAQTISAPTCEVLVAGLEPRLIPGNVDSILATNGALPEGAADVQWFLEPQPDCCGRTVCARVSAMVGDLAPGEYSLVLILHNASLEAAFGEQATTQLRSTQVTTVQFGPPVDQAGELFRLLKIADRALEAQQWSTAAANADAMLAIYPNSALAWKLRGHAREGLGDTAGALAAFATALQLLESGQDDQTRLFQNESRRKEWRHILWVLSQPDDEED